MDDNSRRNLLKLASATAVFGIPSRVKADATTRHSRRLEVDYDLRVENNRHEPAAISVAIYENTDAEQTVGRMPVRSRSFDLPPRAKGTNLRKTSLELSGGSYVVEASTKAGESNRASLHVPPGGIPDYQGVSVRIKEDSRIDVGVKEI